MDAGADRRLAGRPHVGPRDRPSVRDGPVLSASRQAFSAEYQCRPLRTTVAPGMMLTADEIAKQDQRPARRHGPALGRVADGLRRRRQEYLFYAVVRLGQGFYRLRDRVRHVAPSSAAATSEVGRQPHHRLLLRRASPGLAGANEATMLAAALDTFLPELRAKVWPTPRGRSSLASGSFATRGTWATW